MPSNVDLAASHAAATLRANKGTMPFWLAVETAASLYSCSPKQVQMEMMRRAALKRRKASQQSQLTLGL